MKRNRELVEAALKAGGIRQKDAARLCKTANADAERIFREHGLVPMVNIPLGNGKRATRIWVRIEIEKLANELHPPKQQLALEVVVDKSKNIVAGEKNGGKLMRRLANQNERITSLEEQFYEFESRLAALERGYTNKKAMGL